MGEDREMSLQGAAIMVAAAVFGIGAVAGTACTLVLQWVF